MEGHKRRLRAPERERKEVGMWQVCRAGEAHRICCGGGWTLEGGRQGAGWSWPLPA